MTTALLEYEEQSTRQRYLENELKEAAAKNGDAAR